MSTILSEAIFKSLIEYGISGAVFASMMALVIVPVVRAFIASQRDSIALLRKAVETNTQAVLTFQAFEKSEGQLHAQLIETQRSILRRLDDLHDRLVTK